MRKSKFTESQIVAILAEGDAGLAIAEVVILPFLVGVRSRATRSWPTAVLV